MKTIRIEVSSILGSVDAANAIEKAKPARREKSDAEKYGLKVWSFLRRFKDEEVPFEDIKLVLTRDRQSPVENAGYADDILGHRSRTATEIIVGKDEPKASVVTRASQIYRGWLLADES